MSEWKARFIAPDEDFAGAPLLRKTFTLDKDPSQIRSAHLALTALGVVQASINGAPVSDDVLTPGWTTYQWRLRHAIYDVADLLTSTTSTIGLALGNGWYRGRLGWRDGAEPYGAELAGFAELRVSYYDGSEQILPTDSTWGAGASPTTSNSLYDGQDIDARLASLGWDTNGFDDSTWGGVHEIDFDLDKLEPYIAPPVRRLSERKPQRIWTSPAGRVLVDFGQNLVGWVRVSVSGTAGETITLRHAEVLERDELGTRPLHSRSHRQVYTLRLRRRLRTHLHLPRIPVR